MKLTTEDFVIRWNSSDSVELLDENLREQWVSALVTVTDSMLANIDIPGKSKEFLSYAGLPRKDHWIGADFSLLQNGIVSADRLRPQDIENGIEYPKLRYQMFYVIGSDGYPNSSNFCIEKYSGYVYSKSL